MVTIKDKTFELFITKEEISEKISALGAVLSKDYKHKKPLFISVLNGAFIFSADLFRTIRADAEITFIRLSSYEELQSTGNVKELLGLKENIFGRDIILIEDIVDTGETLAHLEEVFADLGPKSFKVVTLLHKPDAQRKARIPDYVGFEIPEKFVVGFGLDYDGLGRGLSDIYQLKQ